MNSTLLFCQATFVHVENQEEKLIVLSSGQRPVTEKGYTGGAWQYLAAPDETGGLS